MAGPLGFSSTIGAAVTGAARQGNELFAENRAQQRQDDILQQAWAADADKAAQKWNAQKSSYADQVALRQSILAQTGNNEAAADAVLARIKLNPKMSQDEINNAVKAYSSVPTPPNYKSPFMNNLQSAADAGYSATQTPLNRLQPKYQGMVTPTTPWSAPEQTPIAPSGASPVPSAQPTQPGEAPRTDETAMNAPTTGEPIPLDNLNTPTPSTAPSNLPNTTPGPMPNGVLNIPGKSATINPYQAQRIDQENKKLDLEAQKFKFMQQTKPATPQEAADIDVLKDDAKKYLHDPKTGLQFRYNELRSLASQNVDLTEMQDTIERGLKSNKPQDMFDQLNRVVKPMLGVDLADMGVSNTIPDTNLMKKAISNAIINRLSTLHFGRITNKEAQYVQDGLGSTTTDPNTNMKIVLALRSSVQSAMQSVNKEYQTVYGDPNKPLMQRSQEGRQAQMQAINEYLSRGNTPWPVVHTASEAQSIPVGQWFEDDKGTMRIQTAPGVYKKAGDQM